MAIGQGFQKIARRVGGGFHDVDVHFHTCEYTILRIYSQARRGEPRDRRCIAAVKEVRT
jgi:hypothetical protein